MSFDSTLCVHAITEPNDDRIIVVGCEKGNVHCGGCEDVELPLSLKYIVTARDEMLKQASVTDDDIPF